MSEKPVTRGFVGRRRPADAARIPPGQYDAGSLWPVLSAEPTPPVERSTWQLTIDGRVDQATTWSWEELRGLPERSLTTDIHCVTTWSRLDTSFTGVSVEALLERTGVAEDATHVMAHSRSGYTTNLPLDDVRYDRAWVVWAADGAPLTPEHGGPVRLLVPHLYFWKSAKWLERLELMDHDEPGFWERGGYHDRGDPWREQRYQGDP